MQLSHMSVRTLDRIFDRVFLRRWDEELPLTQSPYGSVLLTQCLSRKGLFF